jgi:hypothetical protein
MITCLRCGRLETAKIHDTMGRQGTGTAAVHAFVGDREAAILRYAAGQLGWSKKSGPGKQRSPSPEFAQWNDAIEAAKSAVKGLAEPIDEHALADYDKYWGEDATSEAAPEAPPDFTLTMETRGLAIHGEAFVVESALNVAAAWADLSEKLEALGIRVTRLDA